MFRQLVILLGFLVVAASAPVGAQTPTPTPGGDCCTIHDGPSCDVSACADCVCNVLDEPLCCLDGSPDGWSLICVGLASSEECSTDCSCGVDPTPVPTPGGDCCSAHGGSSCDEPSCSTCVCAADDACCSGPWDATCVSIARTEDECASECTTCTPLPTEPPDATPTPGVCCDGRDETDVNPGCDESRCEACVCEVDGVCCLDNWDPSCAVIADEECALDCFCPDDGACCDAHGGIGCDDAQCQDCVIAIDSDCGDEWDTSCAGEAAVECAIDCPCGDCCAEQVPDSGIVGCGDKVCQDCVCDIDMECCTLEWDAQCDEISRDECSIACPCNECCEPQVEGSDVVGCGDKPCQDCVCALDRECCELEWDGICAAIVETECNRRCECAGESNCCEARPDDQGCDDTVCESCVCGVDDFCCLDTWDGTCTAIVGDECASACPCGGSSGCPADCDGNGEVRVNEVIQCVNIALGRVGVSSCAACDVNADGSVRVNELIQGVNVLLTGCPTAALGFTWLPE